MDGPPKLIGMVKLDVPRTRKLDAPSLHGVSGLRETIAHVAFDTDGQCWGLVTRYRNRPDLGPEIGQLNHVRWVRFLAIPFMPSEVVTADAWT